MKASQNLQKVYFFIINQNFLGQDEDGFLDYFKDKEKEKSQGDILHKRTITHDIFQFGKSDKNNQKGKIKLQK